MSAVSLLLMLVIFALALRRLKQDFSLGLAFVVGLLVSLPDYMRISFGGGIPELTVHRLLLIGLLLCFRSNPNKSAESLPPPFLRGLIAFGVAQFISMLLSIYFKASIKWLLVYALEIVTYYIIVSRSLTSRDAVVKLLSTVAIALGIVSVLAGFEKYRGLNLSRQLLLGSGQGDIDITATYPHRILLGYAMAMAVPIFFALREREQRKGRKRLMGLLVLLAIAGCYFSNSRGPWSGLILGSVILFIFGSGAMRRSFVLIGLCGAVVIAIKPGVRETVVGAVKSIFEEDSVKANSYNYRWKLWEIAFSEIKKSPERTLFGYGGLSNEAMDLTDYFEKGEGGNANVLGYTSWDNQLACDLIELGVVGFGIEVGIFAAVLFTLIKMLWQSKGSDRSIIAGFIAACAIFMYAMSNVYIFSPQLKVLFWTLVACGIRFGQLKEKDDSPAQAKREPEPEMASHPPYNRHRPRPAAI